MFSNYSLSCVNKLTMKKTICMLLATLSACSISAQIQWLEEPDSVNLNVDNVTEQANFMIGNEPISGPTNFNLTYKVLFLKDKNGWYRLEANDLDVVNSVFGEFSGKALFSAEGIEEVRSYYRKKKYPDLHLNKIRVSVARNPKYNVKDDALVIINEKVLDGKICGIEPNSLTIVDYNGKLTALENKDIAYIDVLGRRYFGVSALYKDFFDLYKVQLNKSISNWKDFFIGASLEKFVDIEGPYDRGVEVNGKRIYIWEHIYQVYDVNVGSRSTTSGVGVQAVTAGATSSEIATGITDASLIRAGNFGFFSSTEQVSRSFIANAYTLGSNFGITNTASNTNGYVVGRPIKVSVSVKVEDGRIINVFQENVFAKPVYGMRFKFVNF